MNVIEVNKITKEYRIGAYAKDSIRGVFKGLWDRKKKAINQFNALDNVSFYVKKGEVLGVIGKNGAGKSTLLKVLSRITYPTFGEIKMNGRIASLLEVGTGFHPELTGRENIFLNGAILGMTRKEIKSKYNEIVKFAGVEKFIDTPVKHYSSGMYVRLAFSVAAHLEPEILIIDEVLAVGDTEFQEKCIGKMKDVSGQGRTVLFVSHNMAAVKSLCSRVIVLEKGKKTFDGNTEEGLKYYQNRQESRTAYNFGNNFENAIGNHNVKLLTFEVLPIKGEILSINSGVMVNFSLFMQIENINFDVTLELYTLDNTLIFHTGAIITSQKDSRTGVYSINAKIPPKLLNSGVYYFSLIVGKNQREGLLKAEQIVRFSLLNETIGSNSSTIPGIIRPQLSFNYEYKGNIEKSINNP